MSGFNPDEYVDVAERITQFYERYPDGRLTTVDFYPQQIGDKNFVVCHAKAYRNPDDVLPGDGVAWEPVPGPTQFTRDSELMNAQTAAVGRAIAMLGFATKKIASRQEVQARNSDPHGLQQSRADNVAATDKQKSMLRRLAKELSLTISEDKFAALTKAEASSQIEELLKAKEATQEAVAVGGGSSDLDDIPFAASEF